MKILSDQIFLFLSSIQFCTMHGDIQESYLMIKLPKTKAQGAFINNNSKCKGDYHFIRGHTLNMNAEGRGEDSKMAPKVQS